MRLIILNIVLVVLTFALKAQDSYVSLEVSPLEVEKGEPISILIKTDSDGAMQFDLPDEFVSAGGVQSGMSSSIDYSTKRAVQFSFQKFMGYFEEEGEFKIGPVKVQSKNGVLKSMSYDIKVKEPINLISADPAKNLNEAIFGIIEQSSLELYEGEPLIASAKVYSQVNLANDQKIYDPFIFDGPAEIYPLQSSAPNNINNEKIAGRNVISFSCGKSLIFAEQAGQYDINPFQISLLYEDPNLMSLQRAKIKSNKAHITIKPLPGNAPKNFIGAVGNFTIKSKSRETKINEGEVFEYKLIISGTGNIHNIENPKLLLPKGLIVYGDPIIQDSIFFTSEGATGSVEFTYNIQATRAGSYTIDGLEISFFNPKDKKYETITSEEIKMRVKAQQDAKVVIQKTDKKPTAKSKLKTILVKNSTPVSSDEEFYNTPTFWGVLGSPLACALLFGFFIKHKEENKEKFEESAKKRGAKKVAKNRLATALLALKANQKDTFFLEIEKGLKVFVANKTGSTETAITRNYLNNLSDTNRLTEENKLKIISILNECDQARFGFETSQTNMEKIYTETDALIHSLEKNLK